MNPARIRVVLFCGGRGSATIVRALLERVDVEPILLINAYDDGRSTGVLRGLLGDLPGPADFRKNFAVLLESQAPKLSMLLEERLQHGAGREEVASSISNAAQGAVRDGLQAYAAALFDDLARNGLSLDCDDCALGNIVLAGAFLTHGRDFNRALEELARLLSVPARVINVDSGASRHLVALKEDGELLDNEAAIVSEQSSVPIANLYLLAHPLSRELRRALEGESVSAKRQELSSMHVGATVSEAAIAAIQSADIILYGPGTQFSSLLPSYLVDGLPEAIDESRARVRAHVVNILHDHDIRGRHAMNIVNLALRFLDDVGNERRRITHVLVNRQEMLYEDTVRLENDAWTTARRLGLDLLEGHFEHPSLPGKHEGRRVVDVALEAWGRGRASR